MMFLGVSFTGNTQTSNPILGYWQDAEHPEKQVEIISQSGRYVGKSINDPNPSKNGRTILKNLVWNDQAKSYRGILINPENGDEFKIEIKMIGTNRFRFSAGKFIFSRTFTFNRITS